MIALDIQNVSHTYKKWGRSLPAALNNLSLQVNQDEVYGFLGPNGAGKTTTIKTILGLLRPDFGTIKVLDKTVPNKSSRQYIGYLPENPYFHTFLTPTESCHFYGRLFGLSRKERQKRISPLLERVEILPLAKSRIGTFSKGQRQRFGLAQALLNNPKLLILDEPLSGLDPLGRVRFKEILSKVHSDGVAMFLSSHILSDVEGLCSKIGMVYKGCLEEEGDVKTLLASSGHLDLESYFVNRYKDKDSRND